MYERDALDGIRNTLAAMHEDERARVNAIAVDLRNIAGTDPLAPLASILVTAEMAAASAAAAAYQH